MRKLCFMVRAAVLFGLLALVWAPAAIAAQETRYMVGVTDVVGVTKAIEASGGRVLEAIPLIDVLVAKIPEQAVPGLEHNPAVRFIELDADEAVWTQEDTLVVLGRNNPSPYTVKGRPLYVHLNGLAIVLLK
jgi:hypothetical protein